MINFIPDIHPPTENEAEALLFVFKKSWLLIENKTGTIRIPLVKDLPRCGVAIIRKQYIGSLGGHACFAAEADAEAQPSDIFAFMELRSLFSRLNEDQIWVAGRANQLVDWQRTHQYCGACGHPTQDKSDERAKICPQCDLTNYPRLSPAVIVAVLKEDKILLARNKRFQIPIYSVLAGFVEPSETLEECVRREVKEEVGIEVKNIRYFGSQPWPFPNSLMIAFTAEYATGDISLQPSEIIDADWFSKENLPQVPPTLSIAGKMIDWFCRRQRKNSEP